MDIKAAVESIKAKILRIAKNPQTDELELRAFMAIGDIEDWNALLHAAECMLDAEGELPEIKTDVELHESIPETYGYNKGINACLPAFAKLKYELTVIGDMAVTDFDDKVVGMVDKAVPVKPTTYAEQRRAEISQAMKMQVEIGKLKSEVDKYKKAHEAVHAKFGFVNDGKGNCVCAYCTKDVDALTNQCANYEMDNMSLAEQNAELQAELAALKEDDKFVCQRCEKKHIEDYAKYSIAVADNKELQAKLKRVEAITVEEIVIALIRGRCEYRNATFEVKNKSVESYQAAAVLALIGGAK